MLPTARPSWLHDSATKVGELYSSVVERSFPFPLIGEGVWNIRHYQFCLLLADLQAYLLCKHAATGGFLLHVLMSV